MRIVQADAIRALAALVTVIGLAACSETQAPVPDHTLTLTVSGSGEGTVTSVPAGLDCTHTGGTCSATFPQGTRVTLTATPAARSTFAGWNGGSGAATHTVELASSVAIDAVFDNPQRTGVDVGTGGATITSKDGGLTLVIPAGALPAARRITVERLTAQQLGPEFADLQSQLGVRAAYRLEPDGLQFTVPATVTLKVPAGSSATGAAMELKAPRLILASGTTRATLGVSVEAGTAAGSTVVTTQIGHFSYLIETQSWLATVAIGDVPERSRVNAPFFLDVTATGEPIGIGPSPPRPLRSAQYYRRSHGGIQRVPDQPVLGMTRFDATEFYNGRLEYRCTVVGTGVYHGTVEVTYEDTDLPKSVFDFMQDVDCLARPTLTVTKSGTGTGYVGSDVTGIQCGAQCVAGFDAVDVVLTAIPEQGSRFVEWTGDCVVSPSNGHRATVDMRSMQNRTCNARFEKIPEHELEVGMSGAGTGSVISQPAGIECTKTASGTEGTCAAPFEEGTEVTLIATPAPGSFFAGFTGNGAPGPDGTFVIPMNGPASVGAEFILSWGLTVLVEGEGGRVTSDVGGIDCTAAGGTCVGFIRDGSTVALTAHPAEGWRFVGWDEEYTGGPITTSLVMTGPRTIRALFQRIIQYRIGMNFTGTGSGTVVSAPAGINCVKSGATTTGACAADFEPGTQLRLTATPAEGSNLGGWSGPGTTDTNGDRLVEVDASKEIGVALTVPPRLTVTPSISREHLIPSAPCPHAVGTVVVRNTGTRVFGWTAALPAGETGFTLTTSSGSLNPGATAQIGVFFTCNPRVSLTRAITVTATAPDGDGTATETGLVTMNVFEPGVRLTATLGPFAAGSEIALRRITGGRVAQPDACGLDHLHSTGGGITIDGLGPFPDPAEASCGYGVMIRIRVE